NIIIYDRRKRKASIPHRYMRYFNEDQVSTYLRMKESGWRIYFIRRPRIRKHTIVMISHEGTDVGVIEDSGAFSLNKAIIKLRDLDAH
ncbi:MAG: hypothetical protein U9N50_06315, partial [Pseudomonadota bacterium]|nr:hypothetical protein [Pseudomonadota bacterium]